MESHIFQNSVEVKRFRPVFYDLIIIISMDTSLQGFTIDTPYSFTVLQPQWNLKQ